MPATDPQSRHEPRCSHSTGGVQTDREISKGKVIEHALVAWSGEDDVGAHSAAHGQWNQLDANEQMPAVNTTFTEESYTTKLDPNSIPEEKRRAAERLAREIEAGVTQSDKDASHGVDDMEDEENKFSAVKGTGAYQNGCGQEATVATGVAGPSAAIYKKDAAKPKAPSPSVF